MISPSDIKNEAQNTFSISLFLRFSSNDRSIFSWMFGKQENGKKSKYFF